MQIEQFQIANEAALAAALPSLAVMAPQLVLAFGGPERFAAPTWLAPLRRAVPDAQLVGCSSAGEILGGQVHDGTLCLSAVRFESAGVCSHAETLLGMDDSQACGERLARRIEGMGLRAVFVLGPGVQVNGSAMLEGLKAALPARTLISGGLAGDDGAFVRTHTLGPQGVAERQVVALAFYGDSLVLGNAAFGGWQAFGPARRVTRCTGNVLYELDDRRALDVYRLYLGDYASQLPASGLLFPFEMMDAHGRPSGLIRTILGVDEAEGSLTLAGDIEPQGLLRLMHSSADRLVEAAELAAGAAGESRQAGSGPTLAVLVSCVGRKLVMGDRVEEEVEEVVRKLGPDTFAIGFYSYGEISGSAYYGDCRLHNQTMTVTCISEPAGDSGPRREGPTADSAAAPGDGSSQAPPQAG